MHYMIKVSRANERYALITGDEPLYDVVKVLSDIRIGFSVRWLRTCPKELVR